MKFLYKQQLTQHAKAPELSLEFLGQLGIEQCYLKEIVCKKESTKVNTLFHHHTGFEVHLVTAGQQVYESGGEIFSVKAGTFLFIPPERTHRILSSAEDTIKYSMTFFLNREKDVFGLGRGDYQCFCGEITKEIYDSISYIANENKNKREISNYLVSGRILELVIYFLRQAGLEERIVQKEEYSRDFRIELAKRYIKDNIEQPIHVQEIASYCYLSKKQLTRLFNENEGISPAEYIQREKCYYIENELANPSVSIKSISEKMHFSSEYYFNTFFKKHSGMPPGEYRKMILE